MYVSIDLRSTKMFIAWQTFGSEKAGCLVLSEERSPRTMSPGRTSRNRYGPVPTGARCWGASRDLAPV